MTTHQIINAARAARMIPNPDLCACCGDDMDTDAATTHRARFVTALERTYMGPVCSTCADEHDVCADCGGAFAHAELEAVGDERFCENCVNEARSDLELEYDNLRAERRAWEAQR